MKSEVAIACVLLCCGRLQDQAADPNYEAGPGGVTFQQAVALRKRQGFNSVSLIAAFPTWASDQYAATYADKNGVFPRNAWEAFGVTVRPNTATAKAMHDERGYRPFEILPEREGLADFDRVAPPFGGADKAPWITLHATGNKPRDHGIYAAIETLFRVSPPVPAIDLEPYYTGWMHQNNTIKGERPGWMGIPDAHAGEGPGPVLLRESGAPRAHNRLEPRRRLPLHVVQPADRRMVRPHESDSRRTGHYPIAAVPRRPGNRRHGLGGENGWPKSRRVKGARLGINRI